MSMCHSVVYAGVLYIYISKASTECTTRLFHSSCSRFALTSLLSFEQRLVFRFPKLGVDPRKSRGGQMQDRRVADERNNAVRD